MSDDHGQADDADPLELIRQQCRAIKAALANVDQANPDAGPVIDRMRGTVDTLTYDIGELRHFLPRRTG